MAGQRDNVPQVQAGQGFYCHVTIVTVRRDKRDNGVTIGKSIKKVPSKYLEGTDTDL